MSKKGQKQNNISKYNESIAESYVYKTDQNCNLLFQNKLSNINKWIRFYQALLTKIQFKSFFKKERNLPDILHSVFISLGHIIISP